MEPFFSIIIPTFNRRKRLIFAIKSVLEQDYSDFEIIIIDDGSTDDTYLYVSEFLKKDSRISYYYQDNSERSVARNNGAKYSIGKYLIFLDSDDFFHEKNHLKTIFSFIVNCSNKKKLFFTGVRVLKDNDSFQSRIIKSDELLSIDFFINESIIPARVCIPREFMFEFQFDSSCIIVEDTVLWTQIMNKYSVQYINSFGVTYLLHDNNSVNLTKNNAYKQRLRGLIILFQSVKSISNNIKQKHLSRCFLGIAEYYRLNGKMIQNKLWILYSIIKYPKIDIKHKIKLLLSFDTK
jgi:glycosyltransferase involved in cell wall biosynthesis